MIVELWMRKIDLGDDHEKDVEDTSRYEDSGIQVA
jgi:hypothetical protein